MSFSGEIKEELLRVESSARHCRIAELAAFFQFGGYLKQTEDGRSILKIQTENQIVARKCFTLWRKTFKINADVIVRRNREQKSGMTYLIQTDHEALTERLLDMLKADKKSLSGGRGYSVTDGRLLKNSCCKRAFLRGAYLSVGSMSDPNKAYHLELVCTDERQAMQIKGLLWDFDLEAKVVLRKKYYVVYLKEGENISDFLTIVEAHQGKLEFENTRIVKDMRGMVNRKVNCEVANINKTVNAAAKQIAAIRYIQEHGGLVQLDPQLLEMAYVRLENPDSSLEELGKLLKPPVGKSGVNHRLRKIKEFANGLKD